MVFPHIYQWLFYKYIIYFLPIKFVTFQNFVELQKGIKTIERATEKLITTFKDDQRGKFLSNDFKIFYKENGIRKELTTIETPHQNGVAKQKNQTILNWAHNMAIIPQLPIFLWSEVVNMTI